MFHTMEKDKEILYVKKKYDELKPMIGDTLAVSSLWTSKTTGRPLFKGFAIILFVTSESVTVADRAKFSKAILYEAWNTQCKPCRMVLTEKEMWKDIEVLLEQL